MSGYYVGDKVEIIANEGQVGTIVDRVADFIYLVSLTERACSWNEEFSEDEIRPYVDQLQEMLKKIRTQSSVNLGECKHESVNIYTNSQDEITVSCMKCMRLILPEELKEMQFKTVIINEMAYLKEKANGR